MRVWRHDGACPSQCPGAGRRRGPAGGFRRSPPDRRAAAGRRDPVAGLGHAGPEPEEGRLRAVRGGVVLGDRPGPGPAVTPVFELSGGAYAEFASVTGDQEFRAERPFDVRIVPAELVAKL